MPYPHICILLGNSSSSGGTRSSFISFRLIFVLFVLLSVEYNDKLNNHDE
jgi:hypothetical protein